MRSKPELRRKIRATLHLTPDVRAEKSARLCAAIAASGAWLAARTVALFAPLPHEPDVELLWAHGAGKIFAYPRVNGARIDLFTAASPLELAPGAFGVREPSPDPARAVAPGDLDLILVPGAAFTRTGERLGRGGGFYDRLLAGLTARTCRIGTAFAAQLLDELPVEPHDQRVDFLATEDGLLPPAPLTPAAAPSSQTAESSPARADQPPSFQ